MGSDEEDRALCLYSTFYGGDTQLKLVLGKERVIVLGSCRGHLLTAESGGGAQCCVKSLVGDPNFRFCGSSMAETSGSWLTACGNTGESGFSVLGGAEI